MTEDLIGCSRVDRTGVSIRNQSPAFLVVILRLVPLAMRLGHGPQSAPDPSPASDLHIG